MTKRLDQRLTELTAQYDSAPVECDGMAQILHRALKQAGVEHEVWCGAIRRASDGKFVAPHLWIRVNGLTIDYRARLWLGPDMPHGVFVADEHPEVQYENGKPVSLPVLPDAIIDELISPPPLPAELQCSMMRRTHKPHRLHKDVSGVLWETISYPFVSSEGRVVVKVRVPGDPTTIRTAECLALDPEGVECFCDKRGDFWFKDPERWASIRDRSLQVFAD
jgi:hypothetical protein